MSELINRFSLVPFIRYLSKYLIENPTHEIFSFSDIAFFGIIIDESFVLNTISSVKLVK
jgi:hypothetical protein